MTRLARCALLIGPSLLAACATGGEAGAANDLCLAGERAVFSCSLTGSLASLCLGEASLHYREGRPGRLSVDLANAPDWSNIHLNRLYSQALAQDQVRITAGEVNHILSIGETGPLADVPGQTHVGVTSVIDAREKHRECTNPAVSSGWLDEVRQRVPENFRDSLEEPEGGPFDGYF